MTISGLYLILQLLRYRWQLIVKIPIMTKILQIFPISSDAEAKEYPDWNTFVHVSVWTLK